MKETNAKLDLILDELAKQRHLLKLILRERNNNATETIETILRKKSGIAVEVSRFERELQRSRPWTLNLMKKAALINPNIRFLPGNRQTQQPSRLVWLPKSDLRNHEKIQKIIKKNGHITVREIMHLFETNKKTSLEIAQSFCHIHPEYRYTQSQEYFSGKMKLEDATKIMPPLTKPKTLNKTPKAEYHEPIY